MMRMTMPPLAPVPLPAAASFLFGVVVYIREFAKRIIANHKYLCYSEDRIFAVLHL